MRGKTATVARQSPPRPAVTVGNVPGVLVSPERIIPKGFMFAMSETPREIAMSRPHHAAVLLLGLVPGGLALAPNEAAAAPTDGVGCKIKAVPASRGVRLEGSVTAKCPVSGTYELVVNTGGSNAVRSGAFSARPGEDRALGEVSLDLDSGAFYTAMLKLEWNGVEAARA